MPGIQLLEIDPDKLFENYTVSEVEVIQRSISKEIERKREELRTLVGERYRDLIEAADTIAEMKTLSEEVIQDVQRMTAALTHLKEKHETPVPKAPFKRQEKYSLADEVTAQIGILVDLPELIWTALDEGDYIRAAQLFLLGRHIKTGFQVEKSLKEAASKLTILDRLWASLHHFPSTILQSVEKELKTIGITPQQSLNCLVAVALLENVNLLKKFISLRTTALQTSIELNDVKEEILSSHDTIVHSLLSLQYCFSEVENTAKENVWRVIESISSKESPPVLSLLVPSISVSYLPLVIKNFRANPISKYAPTSKEELKEAVTEWIRFIRDFMSKKGKSLLQGVTTLRTLHSLTCLDIKLCPDWALILESISTEEKLDLWDELYKPLINIRAKELITLHWDEAFGDILTHLKNILNEEFGKHSELDLRWFVWKESLGDLNIKTLHEQTPGGLQLKAKGISPQIADICAHFQSQLDSLFNDLFNLCSGDVLTSDTKELRSHQQATCLNIILKLKEFVREIENKEDINEAKLVIMARVLQSIPELCPALQKCLTLTDDKVNAWHETKTLLQAESISCWGHWEDLVCQRLGKLIPEIMKIPTSYGDVLCIIPQWEVVTIEEGDSESTMHKSELKVPSCPSLTLQTFLHLVHFEISKAHVPRSVSENVMQKLVPLLLQAYPTDALCQSQSLQYLFDIKYILYQFTSPSNKDLSTKCHEKLGEIESKIDPFDLDVLSSYFHANVKTSVQRLQALFGISPHYAEIVSTSAKINDDPSIITLSKTSSNVWFPPLPVTNPSNRPLPIMKSKASKTVVSKQITDTSEALKAGASSFFTDWFS